MNNKKEKIKEGGNSFLIAMCGALGVIIILQARSVDIEKSKGLAWACAEKGADHKSTSYDEKKKLYRIQCK